MGMFRCMLSRDIGCLHPVVVLGASLLLVLPYVPILDGPLPFLTHGVENQEYSISHG
ncbi:hypothetical protein BDV29DRAFT_172168 [Aspergillus leporis]|uniref:Uncharacterized protein n=1 Tax=Aspergillus leporis TaxID=41062 RepID=A0A5N5X7K2_9EURO|nr:hypothetical protein BDV29DRAFT_172168 [Aspergillus leporis]